MTSFLPVVECFHSIQGEGMHVGRSAFFIRLASCKVGCPWCDTKHSWNVDNHQTKSVKQLAADVVIAKQKGAEFVVLTGGEPLHHNLDLLFNSIKEETNKMQIDPIPIHIETSGVDQISGNPNWITLSPKRHAPPNKNLLSKAQEIKVVIFNQEDLIFAEEMAKSAKDSKHNFNPLSIIKENQSQEPFLFLQPGWGNRKGQELAVQHVLHNPKWRLSLQTHKWLEIR